MENDTFVHKNAFDAIGKQPIVGNEYSFKLVTYMRGKGKAKGKGTTSIMAAELRAEKNSGRKAGGGKKSWVVPPRAIPYSKVPAAAVTAPPTPPPEPPKPAKLAAMHKKPKYDEKKKKKNLAAIGLAATLAEIGRGVDGDANGDANDSSNEV